MNSWDYDVEVLAADAAFRRWVTTPDAASNARWQRFLLDHPERRWVLDQARRLVQTHPAAQHLPSEGAVERMWTAIERGIQ